jgi:GDP-L-fucose synthase
MVGGALVRRLEREDCEVLTVTRQECDLKRQEQVERWMGAARPQAVVVAAAKVGGILANDSYPAEFLYDNLMIEANCINAAYRNNVQKLLFLGSSCIYPRNAPQPLKEEYFLTGVLEPTNEPYAIAKIAGIKMCDAYRAQYGCNFISAMPTNLYGPNDNYDLKASHVLPALIRKFIEAKRNNANSVAIWGTGTPKREFLHVDDFASAALYLMEHFNEAGFVNVGTGIDLSIRELAEQIRDVSGFTGDIVYDTEKPDGMPRKLMDVSRLRSLGWAARISLEEGLQRTYDEVKDMEW